MMLRLSVPLLIFLAMTPRCAIADCSCLESPIDLSPLKSKQLTQGLQDRNLPFIRQFAWNLFYSITRGSSKECGGSAVPRFMTWYRKDDAFSGNDCSASPPVGSPENLNFYLQSLTAKQRTLAGLSRDFSAGDGSTAFGGMLFEGVLFNEPLVTFLGKAVHFDRDYDLRKPADLCALGEYAVKNNPPHCKFPQVPLPDKAQTAAAIKLMWLYVPRGIWTGLPVWDPESNPAIPNSGNFARTFTRWVAVRPDVPDPPPGQTTQIAHQFNSFDEQRDALEVSVNRFFSIIVTDETAPFIKKVGAAQVSRFTPAKGDMLLLIAMHIASKVQQDWLWQTLWWHDRPNEGYGADRPPNLSGKWANYRMNVSFDMQFPAEPDGSPRICFNPYLEAAISNNVANENGLTSNCMSCHRLAALPTFDPNRLALTRGPVRIDNPLLQNRLPTDYLWSVARHGCQSTASSH